MEGPTRRLRDWHREFAASQYYAAQAHEKVLWKAVADAWAAGVRHDDELVKTAERASECRAEIFEHLMRVTGLAIQPTFGG